MLLGKLFLFFKAYIDSNSEASADQREEEPAWRQAEASVGGAAGENTRVSTRALRVSDPVKSCSFLSRIFFAPIVSLPLFHTSLTLILPFAALATERTSCGVP